jgi:hypothetical protein
MPVFAWHVICTMTAMVVSNELVTDYGVTVLDDEWRTTPLPRRRSLASPVPGLQRSIGLRGDTQFPVLIYDGVVASHCHAVEVSSTGIVLERGFPGKNHERRGSVRLELYLDGIARPLRVLARSVRWLGTREAYKFTTINDADRLSLSEHLDREWRRGHALY